MLPNARQKQTILDLSKKTPEKQTGIQVYFRQAGPPGKLLGGTGAGL